MDAVQVGVFQRRFAGLRVWGQVLCDDAGADSVSRMDFGDDLASVRDGIAQLCVIDPDMVLRLRDESGRRTVKEDQTVMDHKHTVTDCLHILDDMCGEQNDLVLRHLRENIAELDTLLGVQTDSRLVEYISCGLPSSACAIPTRCL